MMFGRGSKTAEANSEYQLGWPPSRRWNPNYNVPRNSVESAWVPSELESGYDTPTPVKHRNTAQSATRMNARRDADTQAETTQAHHHSGRAHRQEDKFDEWSDLAHWLETSAELYMNNLDNRARWDPRWLNITRCERFEGLEAATITVLDYLKDDSVQQSEPVRNKTQLGQLLQDRPEGSEVRVLVVTDLSRFVMGILGHLYSVEPEFWFEHLINSGYASSDSGLKLKNAVWLNWAEREIHFRHRALPGPGQRIGWNTRHRARDRCWAHMLWGRLGLMNYLRRKGFYETEIHQRVKDGRWLVERDALLDRRGLLMTKRRRQVAEKAKKKKEKKEKKDKKKREQRSVNGQENRGDDVPVVDSTFRRYKTSNIYRAYSTFEGLPMNPPYWNNRDLRVMAPEGASYWTGADGSGRKIVLLLVDPRRSMKDERTGELIQSITFMPRIMEIEAYTEEETWRTAEPDETYLDPPPPALPDKELRKQKREATKARLREKGQCISDKLGEMHKPAAGNAEDKSLSDETDSSESSDSEYDAEYETKLRDQYKEPRAQARDRDFARKYAMSTHDVLCRYLAKVTVRELLGDAPVIPGIVMRMVLDDMWQLLAEMRLDLDHMDGDFSAGMMRQLMEPYGHAILQNANWLRSTLQELREWVKHLAAAAKLLSQPPELREELDELQAELQTLHGRAESTVTLVHSSMAIAQSTMVIEQTSGINKLTELAFLFVPISFITAAFSMQVRELSDAPPGLWAWGVSLTCVVLATYCVRALLRSPTLRLFSRRCRATILSRYSSSKATTAAKQLNAVSNRAMAKFACVVVLGLTAILMAVVAICAVRVAAKHGIWVASVVLAVYFIVTRWPDPAVLGPCFVGIPLAFLGWWLVSLVGKTLDRWALDVIGIVEANILRFIPTKDEVEDEDLAVEGVETFARQAIMLVT
ncbi:hypothetical protein HJFPF1_05253 [Paramyrothecium foliicola]|nr:hypothetical protein HJFPF1_05253 [Paramyrothecium foliicola]